MRGQSASQSRNSSRDVVGSGELAEVYCGQSATGSRTVHNIVLSLSRDVGSSGGAAKLCCGQSAAAYRTVRQLVHFEYGSFVSREF